MPGAGFRPGPAPRPADQVILADMFHEGCERTIAVARGILDLGANLPDGLAFPGHFVGREVPDRIPGHCAKVRRLMADRTTQRREAEAVCASEDRRLMWSRGVALARAIAGRMAIEAPRTGQHLAEFGEISCRPRLLIADRRKAFDAGEAVSRRIRNGFSRQPQPQKRLWLR